MERCCVCSGDANAPDHADGCPLLSLVLLARGSDPSTSHEAMAAFSKERMQSAVTLVVALFRIHGRMADYTLRDRFQTAWPNGDDSLYRQARNQARNQGHVRDSGLRERNPHTRRNQIVWEACDDTPPEVEICPTCGGVIRRRIAEKSH
jgi:hypothetical protein